MKGKDFDGRAYMVWAEDGELQKEEWGDRDGWAVYGVLACMRVLTDRDGGADAAVLVAVDEWEDLLKEWAERDQWNGWNGKGRG